ncbi:MAG: cation-transporting P-type ATPase [Candidatus Thorarchaeota archaeon]|nr:cation-transporting P-type ATPase [Candidatus Thorarchaeota archaeon]
MTEQDTISTESETPEYHALPLDDVLRNLNVDPNKGLSDSDAQKRLQLFGPNTIPKIKGSIWKMYLAPILNWLINIYLLSSFALVALALLFPTENSEIGQALFWLAIVAVNAIVAVFQQFRAQKKLEALEKLSTGDARILRNGSEKNIAPDELVPGDIIILEQGDRIPADSRILSCSNLTANEASLTGESVPVTKDHNLSVEKNVPLTDMRNMVFFGTYVSTGAAKIIVTSTGAKTEIGKIQGTLEQLNTGDIPLRRKVNLLAKFLGIAAVVLMFVSIFWAVYLGPLLTGSPPIQEFDAIIDTITAGITKAMTIMPINIPLLTTIVLLTGVLAMAKQGVIIRDLSAVESLGRVSVICSDKTGTMTKNEMTVKFVWDTESLYTVTGNGYEPTGQIMRLKDPSRFDENAPYDEVDLSDKKSNKDLRLLLICGGINNDSEIMKKEIPGQGSMYIPMGDPTDAALLTLFRKSGLALSELEKKYPIEMEFPFDSEFKRMTKICKDGSAYIALTKGATEVIIERSSRYSVSNKTVAMDAAMSAKILELANDFASRGYRVISLAYRKMSKLPTSKNPREETEQDLIYLGFAAIVDPPRDGVKDAVDDCHSAGINVIMITGDAAATAKTIAENLNIYNINSLAIEGSEIENLTDESFDRVNVFARVNPDHKQVIVERYQDQEKVVAMTGDGVNDALALAMSDAGIAMGIQGTDVAKEAADIIITDDSFSSIVKGVHEGRGLFNKIRMMVYFYIAINLFESIIFFGALFLLPPGFNMLTNWQSLMLVATTHSFPGLALVFDKTSPKAMEEKPRDSEDIITRQLAKFMALGVFLMVLGAATVYFLGFTSWNNYLAIVPENLTGFYNPTSALPDGWDMQIIKATTMLLTVILLVESFLVIVIRRINLPFHKSATEPGYIRYVLLLGLIFLANLLLMYVPEVQEILFGYGLEFYFIPLTLFDWIVCLLAALPAILGMELYKKYLRNRNVTL